MDEISLGVPEPLLESLPEEGSAAARDMQRAVEGFNGRVADSPAGGSWLPESVQARIDADDIHGERFRAVARRAGPLSVPK